MGMGGASVTTTQLAVENVPAVEAGVAAFPHSVLRVAEPAESPPSADSTHHRKSSSPAKTESETMVLKTLSVDYPDSSHIRVPDTGFDSSSTAWPTSISPHPKPARTSSGENDEMI